MALRAPSFLVWDRPLRLWSAMLLPPAAWFFYELGLSAVMRVACGRGGPPLGPGFGAAALTLCGVAAWLAAPRLRRPATRADEAPRRFLAALAVGEAGLFALAIVFQTAATLIVPPCAR